MVRGGREGRDRGQASSGIDGHQRDQSHPRHVELGDTGVWKAGLRLRVQWIEVEEQC